MGGFLMKRTKLELSLAIGLAAMLLYCASRGQSSMLWWSAAFSPLCDGILTHSAATGDIKARRAAGAAAGRKINRAQMRTIYC